MSSENKRRVDTCTPGHECTLEEIRDMIHESRKIDADASVEDFGEASQEDLAKIIRKAQLYTGEWYHSKATISSQLAKTPGTLEYQVAQLGEENGISLSFFMDRRFMDSAETAEYDALEEKLEKMFHKS